MMANLHSHIQYHDIAESQKSRVEALNCMVYVGTSPVAYICTTNVCVATSLKRI